MNFQTWTPNATVLILCSFNSVLKQLNNNSVGLSGLVSPGNTGICLCSVRFLESSGFCIDSLPAQLIHRAQIYKDKHLKILFTLIVAVTHWLKFSLHFCQLGTIGSDMCAIKGAWITWPNAFSSISALLDSRKYQGKWVTTFLFSAWFRCILKVYHSFKWYIE